MSHQNFQEAIAQISTNEDVRGTLISSPNEIKKQFDLNEEDMMNMKFYDPSLQTMTPRPTAYCCCCMQSDN